MPCWIKQQSKAYPALLSLSIFFCLTSCNSTGLLQSSISLTNQIEKPDSLQLIISAQNLTEDMSAISSKNDEVLVLVFSVDDSARQASILFSSSFVLTNKVNEKSLAWKFDKTVNLPLSVLLLERDTDYSDSEIASLVQKHFFKIIGHFAKHGNFGIEPLIHDDDIVGIKTFRKIYMGMQEHFIFSGVYKLDKYDYRLILRSF